MSEKADKNVDALLPGPDLFDSADDESVCFLCGNPAYTEVYTLKKFGYPLSFKRCQCGLEKQIPMPNAKFFEWFFNSEVFFSSRKTGEDDIWGYYDYFSDEPSRIATSRRRYRMLEKFLNVGRKLEAIKIGPATGTFLKELNDHGHHGIGCDVSQEFAEYARTNYDVHIDHGRFEAMPYADNQFDALFLLNVIENVPNLDEFMQAISRTVKPEGIFVFNYVEMHNNLIHKFQKSHYFIYRPPICYTMTRQVIDLMLAKYGFKQEAVYRDIRHMHLEKIATLLRWKWLLNISKILRINRIPFPIYAYPSKIVVARRIKSGN